MAFASYIYKYFTEAYLIILYTCNIADEPYMFTFEVKFYPPDPASLQEDITR